MVFISLLTFSNSGHQAFLTKEALENIGETTIKNLRDLERTGKCEFIVNK